MPRPMRNASPRCSQREQLSPSQLAAYRWIPGEPARESSFA
jgi:hypothetical protein